MPLMAGRLTLALCGLGIHDPDWFNSWLELVSFRQEEENKPAV